LAIWAQGRFSGSIACAMLDSAGGRLCRSAPLDMEIRHTNPYRLSLGMRCSSAPKNSLLTNCWSEAIFESRFGTIKWTMDG